jgi:hypothetical protein
LNHHSFIPVNNVKYFILFILQNLFDTFSRISSIFHLDLIKTFDHFCHTYFGNKSVVFSHHKLKTDFPEIFTIMFSFVSNLLLSILSKFKKVSVYMLFSYGSLKVQNNSLFENDCLLDGFDKKIIFEFRSALSNVCAELSNILTISNLLQRNSCKSTQYCVSSRIFEVIKAIYHVLFNNDNDL